MTATDCAACTGELHDTVAATCSVNQALILGSVWYYSRSSVGYLSIFRRLSD
jgi:hypothetical protein